VGLGGVSRWALGLWWSVLSPPGSPMLRLARHVANLGSRHKPFPFLHLRTQAG